MAGPALILHKKIVGKCFHDRSFSLPLDSSYITLENFGLLEDSFHHIIAWYIYIFVYILHIIYIYYLYVIISISSIWKACHNTDLFQK
jgi:hypothetical protein